MRSYVAAALCGVLGIGVTNAQSRYFTAEDLPNLVRLADPQISPDGRKVAYLISRANLTEDRWETDLEITDVETKLSRVVTHGRQGVSLPSWSPSGNQLAFLAQDLEKQTQIMIAKEDGGDVIQVTHSKTGVKALAWRPDGVALAYASADEEVEKKGEAKFDDAFDIGNNDYLKRSQLTPIHLWIVTLTPKVTETSVAKRLTSGAWSLSNAFAGDGPPSFTFTPNGTSIVYVRAETPLTGDTDSSRLMSLNVATGQSRALTGASVEEEMPIVSPDGERVAYLSLRDGKRKNEVSLFAASAAAGGRGTDLTFALDRSISGAAWLPDSQSLLVALTNHTKKEMWIQPLQGQAHRLEISGLYLQFPGPAMSVSKTGSVAFLAVTAERPVELFYIAHIGEKPVQMTHVQKVTDGRTLGKSVTVGWMCDQFHEDGVLTYPPDYRSGKKYPLVLYIHGGPRSSSLEGFFSAAEALASHGWLVFRPNYRGSDDSGNAYEAAISMDGGVGPGHDVMAGIRAVKALGIVDEKRIAVTGWSYGGYITSWLIGNYPSLWKTAIAGAPVTDLTDQYAASDITWFAPDIFGPSPYVGNNQRLYRLQSPITYAWRIKTPTLILADVGDYRVPITESYKLYRALKDNGVRVSFVAYPIPGHSPTDPIRSRDVLRRWTAWLDSYLQERIE